MKIVDNWIGHLGDMFYSVELSPVHRVDIKIIKETGNIYTMQNHDGSYVYRFPDCTPAPLYPYDETAALKLVAAAYAKVGCNHG